MRVKDELEKLMFATKFIHESNLIENINIAFDEIWREWKKHPLKGHTAALRSATVNANQKKLLTEQIVCEWQKLIIDEQNEKFRKQFEIIPKNQIGKYRTCNVRVGQEICPSPLLAPPLMNNLIQRINEFQETKKQKSEIPIDKTKLLKQISDFHFEFEAIHPFIDGNGRTGRLLVWFLCNYFSTFPPPIFTHYDKKETYYPAFRSKEKMREYFLSKSRA